VVIALKDKTFGKAWLGSIGLLSELKNNTTFFIVFYP